jgi:DNA-directed RNA polymerase subunit RPC12/RpoP
MSSAAETGVTSRIACGSCGKRLRFADADAGKKAKCPRCGTRLVLPGTPEPDAASTPVSGIDPDVFLRVLENMAAEARANRWKNPLVAVLKFFQVVAVLMVVGGLIAARACESGGEKLAGLGVAAVGGIGLFVIYAIADGIGRMKWE